MKVNLAQSTSKQQRISLESQKTITDAVNDVLKITQEREEGEGPKVSVHHTSSSSATPDVAYGAAYPPVAAPVAAPIAAPMAAPMASPVVAQAPVPYPVAPVAAPIAAPYPAPLATAAAYPAVAATPAVVAQPAAGFYPAPYAEHHHHYEPAAEPAKTEQKLEQKVDATKTEEPTVVVEKQLKPKSETREATPEPENESPNSSVLRAIAAANEQAASDKVRDQREVADKLEKLERQSQINDAINKSVKEEEQKVIEEANKRMAEVHSRKAQEANKAASDIQRAKEISKTFIEKAKKEEADAINKVVADHASAVVK